MALLNPFNNNLFTAAELTDAINAIPNQYGRLGEMGLFNVRGVPTDTVTVEERGGVLRLLPSKERGAPASTMEKGTRIRRTFNIPHIPLEDHISPNDVRNLMAFGSADSLEPLMRFVNDRLSDLRASHEQTLEWLRLGALKGQIIDGDGATVLYDLYAEFGITEKTVDLQLGAATTDVKAKCAEITRHIRKNLLGERMTGVRCFVSPDLFDALVNHPSVKEIWDRWQADRPGREEIDTFRFMGITFEVYDAEVTALDGTAVQFFGAAEGRAFPEGTAATFRNYAAPADFNETVNTLGQLYYAKIKEGDFGRGWDIHTQSNPLPLCLRPATLVKVITT